MTPEAATEFRAHLEREASWHRERLAREARFVAAQMGRLAESAEQTGDTLIVNDLGEIQAQASMIDTACARYMTAARLLKDFDAFDKEYER